MNNNLNQYEGPVTVVNGTIPSNRRSWFIFCTCDMNDLRLTSDVASASMDMPPKVELKRSEWKSFNIEPQLDLYVWMGQCPKCGKVYQCWEAINE